MGSHDSESVYSKKVNSQFRLGPIDCIVSVSVIIRLMTCTGCMCLVECHGLLTLDVVLHLSDCFLFLFASIKFGLFSS